LSGHPPPPLAVALPSRRSPSRAGAAVSLVAALALGTGVARPSAAQNVYPSSCLFAPLVRDVDPGGLFNPVGIPNPWGLAIDPAGNIYVADQGDNTIRRIDSLGTMTTLAGTPGVHGTTDGPGAQALFWAPEGVAVDPNGILYVSDTLNNTIRKIAPDGTVSTFAGQPVYGAYADGTGSAARFYFPCELGSDAAGNLYVADWGNTVVRKITPAGVVTTFAGQAGLSGSADGPGPQALFGAQGPEGLALDAAGNVSVTDSANNTVRKITPEGTVSTLAGMAGVPAGSKDGMGSAARFNYPIGVGIDGLGNVYVADTFNLLVRMIAPDGTVTSVAGKAGAAGNGTGSSATFNYPSGLVIGRQGNVYVADPGANAVLVGIFEELPTMLAQPSNQTIAAGATAVFSLSALGGANVLYSWDHDGEPLLEGGTYSGTTGPTLVVSKAGPETAGAYSCLVTDVAGSVRSETVTLTVVNTSNPGRLVNLSCRAPVGTGADELFVGFAVGGADRAGADSLLVRASGPALAEFGLPGVLADPSLQIVGPAGVVASDSSWKGSPAIAQAAADVGAFPWADPLSADSALLASLGAGPYSAVVSGASGDTGLALAEIYDTTPAGAYQPSSPRLVNLSARSMSGTGPGVLIAGFDIGGSTAITVLVRASGPALAPFGLAGTLPDPRLQIFSNGNLVAADTGWAGDSSIAASAAEVGAFSWGNAFTADSALLLTLAPGAYAAEVSGATGDAGVALVEIYEVR
jgi:sugar lactone lactonase YvrE